MIEERFYCLGDSSAFLTLRSKNEQLNLDLIEFQSVEGQMRGFIAFLIAMLCWCSTNMPAQADGTNSDGAAESIPKDKPEQPQKEETAKDSSASEQKKDDTEGKSKKAAKKVREKKRKKKKSSESEKN